MFGIFLALKVADLLVFRESLFSATNMHLIPSCIKGVLEIDQLKLTLYSSSTRCSVFTNDNLEHPLSLNANNAYAFTA